MTVLVWVALIMAMLSLLAAGMAFQEWADEKIKPAKKAGGAPAFGGLLQATIFLLFAWQLWQS